jgi:hypothetical protein
MICVLSGDVDAVDDVFADFWSWARPSPPRQDAGQRDLTLWHLEPAEGLWMRHAEVASAVVVPLPPAVAALLAGGDESGPGASMMWTVARVPAGGEVTRDSIPGARSLQRAATLLALLDRPRYVDPPFA